ncbi:MAG: hypothetical protein NTX52_09435 [Planctomycetota bacterium]|nr:hypothetical protein [Planctomycetota bacterium]
MMAEDKLKELLNEQADATAEQVREGLNEDIKRQIPQSLVPHRGGRDTINIIIDLRISRLAAAAAIIITALLLASLFSSPDSAGAGIYQDSKLLIKYCLQGESTHRNNVLAGLSQLRDAMAQQGREVVYYDNKPDTDDIYAVVMHWKLQDGRYGVIFGDLTTKTVTPNTLIKLQARMLQEKAK